MSPIDPKVKARFAELIARGLSQGPRRRKRLGYPSVAICGKYDTRILACETRADESVGLIDGACDGWLLTALAMSRSGHWSGFAPRA